MNILETVNLTFIFPPSSHIFCIVVIFSTLADELDKPLLRHADATNSDTKR